MDKKSRVVLLTVALLIMCYITACNKNGKDTVVSNDAGSEVMEEFKTTSQSSKGCKFSVDFNNSTEDRVLFKAETADGVVRDSIDLGDCYSSLTIPEQVEIQGKNYTVEEVGSLYAYRIKVGANFNSDYTVTFPDTVKKIDDGCLSGVYISRVVLPKNLQYIGDNAFEESGVEIVDGLPKSVRYIGENAFKVSNKDLTLPAGLEYIGNHAFGNSDIVNLTIEKGITQLSDRAFSGCKELKSIDFPESLEYLGVDCFAECNNLESVTLPDSLKHLGMYCFRDCANLTEVKGSLANVEYYNNSFYRTKFMDNYMADNEDRAIVALGSVLLKYKDDSSDSTVIPDNIKVIVEGACQLSNCYNVTLPEGLTYLDKGWFKYSLNFKANLPETVKYLYDDNGFQHLTEISLPNIVEIGEDTFRQNGNIEKITLADSLVYLGAHAFMNAVNLTDISIDAKNLEFLGTDCFIGTKWIEDKYKSSDFLILDNVLIDVNPDAYNGNDNEIIIPDTVVRIANTNAFYDDNMYDGKWAYGKVVVVPEAVKDIDIGALYGLSNATIKFADGVSEIPAHFLEGSSVGDVVIPRGVKAIGDYAFSKCEIGSGIVEIPDTVETIGEYSFRGTYCISELPEGVREIKTEGVSVSFDNDGEFTLPDSVEMLGKEAIGGNVNNITIGGNTSLKTIYVSSLSSASHWVYKGQAYEVFGKSDNNYTSLLKSMENDGIQVIWDKQLKPEW